LQTWNRFGAQVIQLDPIKLVGLWSPKREIDRVIFGAQATGHELAAGNQKIAGNGLLCSRASDPRPAHFRWKSTYHPDSEHPARPTAEKSHRPAAGVVGALLPQSALTLKR